MAMGFNIDVDVPKVTTIGVVSVLLLVVILVGTHGFYLMYDRAEFAAKHFPATSPLVDQTTAASAKNLHGYGWVNPEQSAVRIPIDRAMQVMAGNRGQTPTTQPLGRGM